MALPDGFTAATITAGPVVDMRGTPAELTVEVTTVLGGPTHITNSATGTVVVAGVPFTTVADISGVVQFTVPHVDSPGWVDPSCAEYSGWKYLVKLRAKFPGNQIVTWQKEIQPVRGQAGPIDVDLVPGGVAGVPQTGATPGVLSVNGMTDHVYCEVLPEGGVEGQVLTRGAEGTAVWVDPATGGTAAHTHGWDEITGKPATYTPSAHGHGWAEITDKPATFPPTAHSHTWDSVTGKPATFAPATHAHEISGINGLWTELEAKPEKPTTPFVVYHNGTAWSHPTLADAEGAGLVDGQLVQFVGTVDVPDWARPPSMRTVIA